MFFLGLEQKRAGGKDTANSVLPATMLGIMPTLWQVVWVVYRSLWVMFVSCSLTYTCTVRAPVFDRHQFFGTSEHYGKAHGSLLSGWMNCNYTAYCWFPTSSNIWILPSHTVLTNQVWKLLIALFKVPNTGAFTVLSELDIATHVHWASKETYWASSERCSLKSTTWKLIIFGHI